MAGGRVPDLAVGWRVVDPGPPARSPLYDTPPVPGPGDDPALVHHLWRQAVEADDRRLAQIHARSVVWFPIPKAGHHVVLPVYGGSQRAWAHMIAGLVVSGVRAGFDDVLVANLAQWDLFGELRAVAAKATTTSMRFDEVSPQGSTVELFGRMPAVELVSLVVDVLRVDDQAVGSRDAARDKQELLQVAQLLGAPVTLPRLRDAVQVALTGTPPPASALTAQEVRALLDHAALVARTPDLSSRLSNLLNDIRDLASYVRDPARRPTRLGAATQPTVRALEVGATHATHERERARNLVARSLARSFARPTPGASLLIVAGAEALSAAVLDDLAATAQRLAKQLVLLFGKIDEDGERILGHAGSGYAVFLRLANHNDATVAASYIGRQYTFVVNGVSLSENHTDSWNHAYGTSVASGTSLGVTGGGTASSAGGALTIGRSFGHSVTKSFTVTRNENHGQGGSRGQGTTVNHARVHEHVIEPEQFQQLDEMHMIAVVDRTVVLGCVDYTIGRHPTASKVPLAIP